MPRVTIDGRATDVPEGATLLDAARALGIAIPTLCHEPGKPALTSCMVCLVRVAGRRELVPSCGVIAVDGMVVESETDEVRAARKTAVELLLDEHRGDCVAPCASACPAGLDVPGFLRLVSAGRWGDAARAAEEALVLPETLGYLCPAPCERACRRGPHDQALAIRTVHRVVACRGPNGKGTAAGEGRPAGRRVAVAGAGPAGLAAAGYLAREGHAVTVFDEGEAPGGELLDAVADGRLPRETLGREIACIAGRGVAFQCKTRVEDAGRALLGQGFDAVLLADGQWDGEKSVGPRAPVSDGRVFSVKNVGASRKVIESVAAGKRAAQEISRFLGGRPGDGPHRDFTTRMGSLDASETAALAAMAADLPRMGEPAAGEGVNEARAEAGRCFHCDCRKEASCGLRKWARALGAEPRKYRGERRPLELMLAGDVVYEPGKCILCGICVRLTGEAGGGACLAFLGRGFSVKVGPPPGLSLAEALGPAAGACVEACPTGALSRRE